MFSIILKGLGKKIFLWFLVVSLIPMSLISVISYNAARKALLQNTQTLLALNANESSKYIENIFNGCQNNITLMSQTKANINFLKKLIDAYKKSGMFLKEFIQSFEWLEITESYENDLITIKNFFNYDDILLISKNGNVMFSLLGESELGTNLISGKYSNNILKKTFKEASKTGKALFTDIIHYKASNNRQIGFIVHDIIDDDGEILGYISIKIVMDQILEMLQKSSNIVRTYLIGNNQILGLTSDKKQAKGILKKINFNKIFKSKNDDQNNSKQSENNSFVQNKLHVYINPQNIKVIGYYHVISSLEKLGVNLALIAEIPESKALKPAIHLKRLSILFVILCVIIIFIISFLIVKNIITPLKTLQNGVEEISKGNLNHKIPIKKKDEIGKVGIAFNKMTKSLSKSMQEIQTLATKAAESRDISEKRSKELEKLNQVLNNTDWLKSGQNKLSEIMRGEQSLIKLSNGIVSFLCQYLDFQVGAFYVANDDKNLNLFGTYAVAKHNKHFTTVEPGQGLIGETAIQKKINIISELPEAYIKVGTSFGQITPKHLMFVPILFEDDVKAVIEFGSFKPITNQGKNFIELVSENIAVAINSCQARDQLKKLKNF